MSEYSADRQRSPKVGIALISNRNSGHNRDRFAKVEKIVRGCRNTEHYPTSSPDEIPAVLKTIAAQRPEVLAINGGDGTAAHVFARLLEDGLFDTPPLIALVPGGTANMTAGDVGIRGSLTTALQRLRRWSNGQGDGREQRVRRHVLRVEPGTGMAPHYGMFFGAGAIIEGTEYAHRKIHSRGLRDDVSLGIGMARTVWGIARGDPAFDRPLPVEMALGNGEFHSYDIRLLAVSSLERLFLGIHPFWGEGDAPLKISFITRGARRFVRRFPGVLRGRPGPGTTADEGFHSYRAQAIRLAMEGHFNLDGEIVEVHRQTGPVTLSAAGPLTFLKL